MDKNKYIYATAFLKRFYVSQCSVLCSFEYLVKTDVS